MGDHEGRQQRKAEANHLCFSFVWNLLDGAQGEESPEFTWIGSSCHMLNLTLITTVLYKRILGCSELFWKTWIGGSQDENACSFGFISLPLLQFLVKKLSHSSLETVKIMWLVWKLDKYIRCQDWGLTFTMRSHFPRNLFYFFIKLSKLADKYHKLSINHRKESEQ